MRITPIARCLTAALVSVTIPATALATPEVGGHDNGWSIADETYLRTYDRCWEAFKEDCGANLLDYAWKGGEAPSEARVERSTATMERWLSPPEPEPTVASSTYSSGVAPSAPVTTTLTPVPVPASDGCTGMEAESGSAGYSAYNPSSGAYGCYQILPSTSAAHGCDLSTPGGQDACAASICATEGPGAWSASGVSPC